MKQSIKQKLSQEKIDRIIAMAWEDRTPFESIAFQFQLSESEVIKLMRQEMKPSSFKHWRKRVTGRNTKHQKKRNASVNRFRSKMQRAISLNKSSK